MWPVGDDVLVAGLAEGDPDAAVAFVRRYQARVFGLAITVVGDAATAEDVAQEAFVRAWRHAGAYDPRRGSVPTWLLTITRRLAIDALRLRRADPLDPETIVALHRGHVDAPDGAVIAADEFSRVRSALVDLPVEQRRAVVLASYYGQTAREVSDREGIPLGTAKTRIRAGLMKLRAALAPASHEGDW